MHVTYSFSIAQQEEETVSLTLFQLQLLCHFHAQFGISIPVRLNACMPCVGCPYRVMDVATGA